MRKNILFITADQFRHDALGLCGAFPVKTPNLDRLADSGCLFENAYCGNPLCTPSRASIMTGRQSFQHGVYYNDQNWPRGLPTIPGMLSENGCYSVKVGPTHFQPPLLHGGFDKIVGNFDLKHRFDPSMGERDLPGWAGVLQSQYAPSKTPPSRERFEPVVHTNEALKQLHRIEQPGGRQAS